MNNRHIIIALIAVIGALSYFYYHSVEQLPARIQQSDQTMLWTDSMRNSYKVTLLSQRAYNNYILAIRDADEDQIYDVIDYLNASLGFIHSPYIDKEGFIELLEPHILENIEILDAHGLNLSEQHSARIKDNFEAIRVKGMKMEQGIWTKFQRDYTAFQSNEFHIQIIYQVAALAAITLFTIIAFQYAKQRKLLHDIREQDQKLRESEDRFSLAMKGANDGLWDWNLDTGYVYYSPRWSEMLGYTTDELEPSLSSWEKLVSPDDKDRVIQLVEDYISGKTRNFTTEFQMQHKDGSWKTILSRAFLSQDQQAGKRLVGTHVDITDRKKIERTIKEMNEELEAKVERRTRELAEARDDAQAANQVKSDFLANISHEIRTPMNAIIGMSQLAIDKGLQGKQLDYIQKVNRSANDLLGIINDILDFSKIESGKLQLEDGDLRIDDVIENLRNLIGLKAEEKGLQLDIHIDPDIPPVLIGDPLRLGQVLTNLGNNAVKFTEPGGNISIDASLVQLEDGIAGIHFSITDDGIGISEEQLAKLFQPFTQVDGSIAREYGGTGLGLSISKHLVELMQGEIWAESQLDIGSSFHFQVELKQQTNPIAEENSKPDEKEQLHSSLEQLRSSKILLVEDNELNRELATEILSNNGIDVDTAENGQQALDALKRNDTHYDGILMDCMMPVMDGYTAAHEIRKLPGHEDLPIIAMTANAMVGDREKAIAAGMNDHIAKPITKTSMFNTMARWIQPDHSASRKPDVIDTDPQEAEELPGIDIQQGLDNIGLDFASYRNLLIKFRDRNRDFAQKFRDAQKDQSADAEKIVAHNLKGIVGTLGAMDLARAAERLEKACFEEPEKTETCFNETIEALDVVIDSIDRLERSGS